MIELKTYLGLALIFYFSHVLFSVLGVFISDRLNIGELLFDLKSDVKKMSICSLFALVVPVIVLYYVQHPGVIILYVIIFFTVTKIAYLGISLVELGIIVLVNFLGMGVFRVVVTSKFLLILFILFLFVIMLIFFIRLQTEKTTQKKQSLFEKQREAEIAEIVKNDLNFKTLCFECKHYDQTNRECSLDLFNKKKEIRLFVNGLSNTYCLYYEIVPEKV